MKRILLFLLIFSLFLSGCAAERPAPRLQVIATVYPMEAAALAVTAGVPGVAVRRMVADTGGCVHDYNLSVRDLQALEGADLLLLSGAGLESFLEDLLSRYPELLICDASQGVETRRAVHHHHKGEEHHHEYESDPHLWLDPEKYSRQVLNIAAALAEADPEYAESYEKNAAAYCEKLAAADRELSALLSDLSCRELITFHEGFGYLADRYGLHVTGIEEEAGGEASAKVLLDLAERIREEAIPAVFYEQNGSDRSAEVLSRECDVPARALSMLMDGDGDPDHFIDAMIENGRIIAEVYGK